MPPTFPAALHQVLDVIAEKKRDVRTMRVMGRNTDGSAQLRREDGECVGRGQSDAYAGQTIRHLDSLGFKQSGASGISLLSRRGSHSLLWVEAVDPHDLPRGATTNVSITGRGFTETTAIDFLLPGTDEINGDIAQSNQTLVSSEEITMDLTVGGAVDLYVEAAIAYDDAARPL